MSSGQQSFQERLARLEQKHQSQAPSTSEGGASGGWSSAEAEGLRPAPRKASGGSRLVLALFSLMVIPAGLYVAMLYIEGKQKTFAMMDYQAGLGVVALGPDDQAKPMRTAESLGLVTDMHLAPKPKPEPGRTNRTGAIAKWEPFGKTSKTWNRLKPSDM